MFRLFDVSHLKSKGIMGKGKTVATVIVGTLLLLILLLTACSDLQLVGSAASSLPQQYVLASTPLSTSAAPETRVSLDAIRWSGPNFPRDAAGTPIPAKFGVPAGIAANNNSSYVLAWFDPSSVLHTQTSTDGLVWADDMTHGTFSVNQNSRPTVTYDYDHETWFVAFAEIGGTVVVQRVRPTTGTPIRPGGVTASLFPAIEWVDHQFVLAYKRGVGVQILTSQNGINWPTGPGVNALTGGTPVVSDGAPFLRNFGGTLYMTTNTITPTPLSHGEIVIYSSTNGINWTLEQTLSPTNPFSRGASVTGPSSELVVADATSGAVSTDIWKNSARQTILPTRTQYEGSLAFGPRSQVVRQVQLNFRQFTRSPDPGPFAGSEDVTLEVRYVSLTGALIKEMTPNTVNNATLNQIHLWNEGRGGPLPVFVAPLMQPGESIVVSVTGDDGTVSRTLTYTGVVSGSDCGGIRFNVGPLTAVHYVLSRTCTVVNP